MEMSSKLNENVAMQTITSLVDDEPPMVSEDAEPLTLLVGNEYEMGWRSVHIHGKNESVYIKETGAGLLLKVIAK